MSQNKDHWEKVYNDRKPDEVSWFQDDPTQSLAMVERAGLPKGARIIDVGGGASSLVDRLLALGYSDLSVLDISGKALAYAKERLGASSANIKWLEVDITRFTPTEVYDLWHDRAVFHFLTDPADRARYLEGLKRGLRPGGTLVLASFAPDGPEKCSGLAVCRYGREDILAALGPEFELLEVEAETHKTPWDTEQRFNYFRLKFLG